MEDRTEVKVYPLFATAMIQQGHGNAYRAWSLARTHGDIRKGWLPAKLLRRYDRRWVRAAIGLGILIPGKNQTIAWTSLPKLCERFGIKDPGSPFVLDCAKLLSSKWKAHVYGGALSFVNQSGKPISRATIQDLTGSPKTTQLRYESHLGIEPIPQIGVGKFPAGKASRHITREAKGGQLWEWDRANVYAADACLMFSKAQKLILEAGRSGPRSDGSRFGRINFSDYREAGKAVTQMLMTGENVRQVYCQQDNGLWELIWN